MASATRLVASSALFALLFQCAFCHFNLINPRPWNPIDCNRPSCKGPCPPIWLSGPAAAANSPENPAASWARGDEVEIDWHRNNHEGGFYRRSLVPVKYMMSHKWHAKTAFEWGCWAQGLWDCGTDVLCGTDKRGKAYRNFMRVPRIFPDGDYVFAQVWYGGLGWRRKKGYFPDYYTCSFVRIEGGEFSKQHKPKFVPGPSHRRRHRVNPVPRGKCVSSSSWIGECKGQGCKWRRPFKGVPGEFTKGRRPKTLYRKNFPRRVVPLYASRADLQFGTMQEELAAIRENAKEHRSDNWFGNQQANEERYQKAKGGLRRVFRTVWQAIRTSSSMEQLVQRAKLAQKDI